MGLEQRAVATAEGTSSQELEVSFWKPQPTCTGTPQSDQTDSPLFGPGMDACGLAGMLVPCHPMPRSVTLLGGGQPHSSPAMLLTIHAREHFPDQLWADPVWGFTTHNVPRTSLPSPHKDQGAEDTEITDCNGKT